MNRKLSKRVLSIESVKERESFEAPIDRYYDGSPFHRAKDIGIYDVERIVAECGKALVRSSQEFYVTTSGLTRKLIWTNLLFEQENGVFWQATVKSYVYNTEHAFEGTYTILVTAPDPVIAAKEIERLQATYGTPVEQQSPAFFLLREERGQAIRVPLDKKYEMSTADINLHYGGEFLDWSERFMQGLGESGLSILRGKPGTGKTSFLRHVVSKLWKTHRFYYVPPDSFGLLSSTMLPEIWSREHRNYPNAVKVIILEDAENLLLERSDGNTGGVSSLLNLTDGFVADLVHMHLVCTINCDVDALDDAVLRPGRQRFFREFELLSYERSVQLASRLGVSLTEQRQYSLAEIYHLMDEELMGSELLKARRLEPIGFC